MHLMSKDEPMTTIKLGKICNDFLVNELPRLGKLRRYYDGRQDIMRKEASDTGKPCNRIVVNYCYSIVENYLGYLSGIPISYSGDDFDRILDVLRYNDVVNEDSEYLRDALIYGRSFEVAYIDEDGEQRFRTLDPRQCIPIYSNTLDKELLYVIRLWSADTLDKVTYTVEVYSQTTTYIYKSGEGFSTFELVDERPNVYAQVPVTVFSLNADERSVFEQIITLQDAYNSLLSDEVDDFDAFADAYLVLKGCMAEDDELALMKQKRVLEMDADASAEYLTKSISDTQIQNILQNVNSQIHKISNSPDFSDEKFMAQSGIAMRYKLVGFENQASSIEANMRKALTRRIELIAYVLNLVTADTWADASIRFTRNLPVNVDETARLAASLRGLVSDETLLGLLPFVEDVPEEMKRLKEQKEYSLYDFEREVTDGDRLLEQ